MGYDIVMFDGRDVYRVEVKSASQKSKINRKDKSANLYSFCVSRGSRVKRLISEDDADIVCFVAVDMKAVSFAPVKSITSVRVRKNASQFGDEALSLEKALRQLRKRRK
jgi:hypothetical protein